MAMVLTEVFMGGPEISLRVKEEQVERIFHLVTSGATAVPELMDTLQSMVKVCVYSVCVCGCVCWWLLYTAVLCKVEDMDLPIKRNQAFVIKCFSKCRDKFCDHILGEGKKSYRWELLTEVGVYWRSHHTEIVLVML